MAIPRDCACGRPIAQGDLVSGATRCRKCRKRRKRPKGSQRQQAARVFFDHAKRVEGERKRRGG